MGTDGYIEVYDADTNTLIHTFTSSDWSTYNSSKPYTYGYEVGHIRVETSKAKANTTLNVYHIKEIDDEKIIQDFTETEFNNLAYIESNLKTTMTLNGTPSVYNRQERASYMAPESIAVITSVTPTYVATGETSKNVQIKFSVTADNVKEAKWKDGTFLLKFPSEILDVEVNNIIINKPNVIIQGYDIEKIGDNLFLKIQTANEIEDIYNITVNTNITSDSRIGTTSKNIELYAYNPNNKIYSSNARAQDIYDINGNGNLTEYVAYSTKSIDILAPSGLITAQTITDYNNNGDITVSPQVAEIDKSDSSRTAKINVYLKSNYQDGISEIKLVGKIPFENNTSQITDIDLGSTYTANMTSGGITIPTELVGIATVYYSVKEQVTEDLNNPANGWTTTPSDFSLVKTYLIDMGEYVMQSDEEQILSYTVEVPGGIPYNGVSYSTHAVYFYLHTEGGKLADQTETNKAGIRIARKYDVEITKYKEGTLETVQGATYSAKAEGETVSKIGTTNEFGKAILKNLYVEKIYTLKEIGSPADYELNEDEVKFIIEEDEFGELELRVISGSFVSVPAITLVGGKDTLQVETEDREKYSLTINKTDEETGDPLKGVVFNVKGKGISESGRNYITNDLGQIKITGLCMNGEYTLTETKATGYYLDKGEIVFELTKDNFGVLGFSVIQGSFKGSAGVQQLPGVAQVQVTVELENEKIPTYNLKLTKTEKGKQEIKLEGARFALRGPGIEGDKIYTTNEFGELAIEGLYTYVAGKNIDGIYELEEIYPPDGYGLNDAIVRFRIVQDEYENLSIEYIENKFFEEEYEVEIDQIEREVVVTFEDHPLFKLTKKDGTTMASMPNVKFAIFEIDEQGEEIVAIDANGNIVGELEEINGVQYRIVTTDEFGEINAGLGQGLYKLIEMETLEGYYLPEQIEARTYYFGIQVEETITKELQKEWNVSGDDLEYENIDRTMKKTSDGGCIVVRNYSTSVEIPGEDTVDGNPISFPSSGPITIKYNNAGKIEFAKKFGSVNGVIEIADGGYIVTGSCSAGTIPGTDTLDGNPISLVAGGLIIKYNNAGKVEYAKSFTGANCQGATKTTDGGYIAVGLFNNPITIPGTDTLDGNPITFTTGSTSNYKGFIIKYNCYGKVEFAKEIGTTYEGLRNIAETLDGGYVVVGFIGSTLTIPGIETADGNPITLVDNGLAGMSGLVIKYNNEWKAEYAKILEYSGSIGMPIELSSVNATPDGGFIVGDANYSILIPAIDTADGIQIIGSGEIKYNSEGKVEYVKRTTGVGRYNLNKVIKTMDGGYIAVGNVTILSSVTIEGEYTADGNPIILPGRGGGWENEKSGVIIKYNSLGKIEFAKRIVKASSGTTGDRVLNGIAETSDGGFVVSGYFSSGTIEILGNETADGNPITLTRSGTRDGFIIKYNSLGLVEYAKSLGVTNITEIYGVTRTQDGGFVATGNFNGPSITILGTETVDGNPITLTNNGTRNGLIIKYNSLGEVEYAQSYGGTGNDYLYGVDITKDGGYVLNGTFDSPSITIPGTETASGNPITLTNDGTKDGLIIKYNNVGKIEYAKKVGATNQIDLNGEVTKTKDGGYIVTGTFATFPNESITIPGVSTADGNPITLTKNVFGTSGLIIKYNSLGKIEYARGIGGTNNSTLKDVAETPDGGYVAVGTNASTIVIPAEETAYGQTIVLNGNNGIIIKYNNEWKVEYAEDINRANAVSFNGVVVIPDGSIVVVGAIGDYGYIEKFSEVKTYTRVQKEETIKKTLEKEWNTPGYDFEYEIREKLMKKTKDGGCIVVRNLGAGATIPGEDTADGNPIILTSGYAIIKYNSEGKVEFTKRHENVREIIELADGGYIAVGSCSTETIPGTETLDGNPITLIDGVLIIKYNSIGLVEYAQSYGSGQLRGATETKDGGYIVIGGGSATIPGEDTLDGNPITLTNNLSVIKYNYEGKVEYVREIATGGVGIATGGVAETKDEGYIVVGAYQSNGGSISLIIPGEDTLDGNPIILTGFLAASGVIIKYNYEGKVEYAKCIGETSTGIGIIMLRMVTATPDGGYITENGNFDGVKIPAIDTLDGQEIAGIGIIKYNSEGKAEYIKNDSTGAGTYNLNKVIKTLDEGYVAVGCVMTTNTITIPGAETADGNPIVLVSSGGRYWWY